MKALVGNQNHFRNGFPGVKLVVMEDILNISCSGLGMQNIKFLLFFFSILNFSQNSECPVALCSCKCFDMDGTIPKSYRDVS